MILYFRYAVFAFRSSYVSRQSPNLLTCSLSPVSDFVAREWIQIYSTKYIALISASSASSNFQHFASVLIPRADPKMIIFSVLHSQRIRLGISQFCVEPNSVGRNDGFYSEPVLAPVKPFDFPRLCFLTS